MPNITSHYKMKHSPLIFGIILLMFVVIPAHAQVIHSPEYYQRQKRESNRIDENGMKLKERALYCYKQRRAVSGAFSDIVHSVYKLEYSRGGYLAHSQILDFEQYIRYTSEHAYEAIRLEMYNGSNTTKCRQIKEQAIARMRKITSVLPPSDEPLIPK